ncbi:MAG: NAD(P)-binding protein [Myxococcales bacterium]|nr:NAD(P)-binding protein [Myxococcales bacterium]
MATRKLETDYLVIGAGVSGMAFADALISDSDADVILVDKRHAPGGHWNDAYPFVRLHNPSAIYGVNSMALGGNTIDDEGTNAGFYERASGAEICAYFDRVLHKQLLPTGRVRFFGCCEADAEGNLVNRLSGETYEVKVRRKVVNASYLEASVPSTHRRRFEVAEGVRCVPVNELVRTVELPEGYVIIGAGKTALDTCVWLLENGTKPGDIRWVKPRESWVHNRTYIQPLDQVGNLLEGMARGYEALALAKSMDDLFERLEAADQLIRVDRKVTPTMYKGATVTEGEIQQLRRIENVVRMGKVQRIAHDEIVLEGGTIPTNEAQLHVDCTARGLNLARPIPIFGEREITIQTVVFATYPISPAIIGYLEATRDDVAVNNALCQPMVQPDSREDWLHTTVKTGKAYARLSKEPDIAAWLENSRLHLSRGLMARAGEPAVLDAYQRYQANRRPALENYQRLVGEQGGAA